MQCDDPTPTCQGTDRVFDAKSRMIEEFAAAKLRAERRAATDANLVATAEARRVRLEAARPENRRLGCVAAWQHLRAAGLGSELVDSVLTDLAAS